MPINEAIEQFLSDDGYRITLPLANGNEITLRRDNEKPPELNALDSWVVECKASIRKKVPTYGIG
jgi:hypothetical protein